MEISLGGHKISYIEFTDYKREDYQPDHEYNCLTIHLSEGDPSSEYSIKSQIKLWNQNTEKCVALTKLFPAPPPVVEEQPAAEPLAASEQ